MRSIGRRSAYPLAVVGAGLAALLLGGCATPATQASSPDPRIVGSWHLRSGTDARGDFSLGSADITLTIGDSGHTGGRSACTRYTARVTGGIGPVFVTTNPTLSDRCQSIPAAVLDGRYLDELAASRLASVSDGALTLRSGSGDLRFTKVGVATTLAGHTWVLDQLSNATSEWLATSVRGAATLRFSSTGVFEISTTCATLTAHYRATGQSVSVSHYSEDVSASGICNDKTGAVGAEVMTLVGGAFTYELQHGRLLMTANSFGSSATFVERGAA